MALTVTQKYQAAVGDAFLREFEVTFDASYPTGGEPITPSTSPFSDFYHEIVAILSVNTISPLFSEKIVRFDPVASTLVIGVEGAAIFAEAASASNQATVKARVVGLFR